MINNQANQSPSERLKPTGLSQPISLQECAEQIRNLCDSIVSEFHPEKIILFGSHAYGNPSWDSDVDLLVIMPFKGRPARQAIRIRSRVDTPFALDMLVRTPEQIVERLLMGDFFIREIVERGKVLYEANHKRVGRQSGR
jgi:predicted nucleotidyltransferase